MKRFPFEESKYLQQDPLFFLQSEVANDEQLLRVNCISGSLIVRFSKP